MTGHEFHFLTIEVSVVAGATLHESVAQLITLAQRLNANVYTQFNGIPISVTPESTVARIEEVYAHNMMCNMARRQT